MNIKEYGYTGTQEGCVARITAVHRDRFSIAGDFGEGHARLKAGEYYAGDEIFPTAGELDTERWESYRKLKAEAVDKDELLRRKREWSKGVAKFTKQRKKEIW